MLNVTGLSGMCPFILRVLFFKIKSSAFTPSASCSPAPSLKWIDQHRSSVAAVGACCFAPLSPHPPVPPPVPPPPPQRGRLGTFPSVFSETSVQSINRQPLSALASFALGKQQQNAAASQTRASLASARHDLCEPELLEGAQNLLEEDTGSGSCFSFSLYIVSIVQE